MEGWESVLEEFRGLLSDEGAVHRLKAVDIPSLEEQIRDQDKSLPSLAENSEKVLPITFLIYRSDLSAAD